MKYTNIFLMIFMCMSTIIHGMQRVDEWIGIEKHWPSDSRTWTQPGSIYRHCSWKKRNKDCAVINAYLLLMRKHKEIEQNKSNIVETQEKPYRAHIGNTFNMPADKL